MTPVGHAARGRANSRRWRVALVTLTMSAGSGRERMRRWSRRSLRNAHDTRAVFASALRGGVVVKFGPYSVSHAMRAPDTSAQRHA
jgi:hypothetical protein